MGVAVALLVLAAGATADDALASCGVDAVAAASSLDAQTGAWSRWFAGKPDVSNVAPLGEMQGILALGAAAASPTPTPATPTPPPSGPAGRPPEPLTPDRLRKDWSSSSMSPPMGSGSTA